LAFSKTLIYGETVATPGKKSGHKEGKNNIYERTVGFGKLGGEYHPRIHKQIPGKYPSERG
jgi:hypothetical protein